MSSFRFALSRSTARSLAPLVRWLPLPLVGFALACSTPETSSMAGGSGGGSGGGASQSTTLAESSFGTIEMWAAPIEDYIAAGSEAHGAGQFFTTIHDLAVYEDRLYLSYGDANVNMGRTIPIGLRYFAAETAPLAINEHDTVEEQIERYRQLGETLWAAGVDATQDGWLGNVYLRSPSQPWQTSRTLDGGVHVHDVAAFGGSHWAVGSGATETEWGNGDIYAHLWRSDDAGTSFSIAERVHNGGDGDARWVRLLAHGDELHLFGYTSNAEFQIDAIIGATYDGTNLTMLAGDHPLSSVFVTETEPFADGTGLVRGVDVGAEQLVERAYLVDDHGAREVAGLIGYTVLDVFEHDATGEKLILVRDGDTYDSAAPPASWNVRLFVTADFEELTELFSFPSSTLPVSVAFWRGHLFLGMDDGHVYRGTVTPPR